MTMQAFISTSPEFENRRFAAPGEVFYADDVGAPARWTLATTAQITASMTGRAGPPNGGAGTNLPNIIKTFIPDFAGGSSGGGGGGSTSLAALLLSSTAFSTGSVTSVGINGKTAGSTITATSSDNTVLMVSGTTLSGTFTAAGSPTITLVETLSGATNSPRTNPISATVSAGGTVSLIRTSKNNATPLAVDGTAPVFAAVSGTVNRQIIIDPATTFQTFRGAGGAFISDSSAYLAYQMTQTNRTAILTEMFGTNRSNIIRIPIGPTSFTYRRDGSNNPLFPTYDDVAGDTSLTSFSISDDMTYRVPLIKEIIAINPSVNIIASLITPPGWMKTSASQTTNGGNIDPANFTVLANYFVKFLQAYSAQGIVVSLLTIQNEPDIATAYPSCLWSEAQIATFQGTYLKPALTTAGFTAVRVLTADDNYTSVSSYTTAVMGDTNAASITKGVAAHAYGGSPGALTTLHGTYPTLENWLTEFRSLYATSVSDDAALMAGEIGINLMRNYGNAFHLFNLFLDQNGDPSTANTGRRPTIAVNNSTFAVTRTAEFYLIAHYAKFIDVGAVRIGSSTYITDSTGTDIGSTAWLNPNGNVVVFLFNGSDTTNRTAKIVDAASNLSTDITLTPRQMATLIYPGVAASTTPLAVTGLTNTGVTGSSVSLAWTAAASGVTPYGYVINRSTTAGKTVPIAIVPVGTTTYVDTAVSNGITYYYTVQPYKGGLGAIGTQISATTSGTVAPTLNDLTISPGSATTGALYTGTITGITSGSTVTVTSADGTTMTVSGNTVTGTFTNPSAANALTPVETLAGASNTPHTSPSSNVVISAATTTLAQDTFTSNTTYPDGTAIAASGRTTDSGHSWSRSTFSSFATKTLYMSGGHTYGDITSQYQLSLIPSVADYDVEGAFTMLSSGTANKIYVGGRVDGTANTGIFIRYVTSTGIWELVQFSAGTATIIGTYTQAISVGTPVTARLVMRGTTVSMLLNGTSRASGTTTITAVGVVAIRQDSNATTATQGTQIDTITVYSA